MSGARDFLVELGTEELPPSALTRLATAFADGVTAGLERAGLGHGDARWYATPRRLAVQVERLDAEQPARESQRRGPALKAAFDAAGAPTRAAAGFARSCGVEVEALERLETDDGAWLVYRSVVPAQPAAALLPDIVNDALGRLPIPRRMRWGSSDAEFVRPVRWLVMLHGEEVVPCTVLGVEAGRVTHGHRFHAPQPLSLASPAHYVERLRDDGRVLVDFDERRARVRAGVECAAAETGGIVVIDEALLDEVTALTEWPVALAGSFEPRFLAVPAAALVATMKSNQKYFHLVDAGGALQPGFIAVANLESSNPDSVRRGNERVVRPRLADAEFFYNTDLKTALADRLAALETVVFQQRLGSVADKARRVAALAGELAGRMGAGDAVRAAAARAGLLGKCDLVTDMVGEFPELQGVMGERYAEASGEGEAVARAIGELYLPRFAGDALPATPAGMALAVADRLDTVTGIFGIGQPPSGDKDPFALRRAALGVLRVLIECRVDVDLRELLGVAAGAHEAGFDADAVAEEVFEFHLERLRAYFAERGVSAQVFAAVHARRPTRPLDFAARISAVEAFRSLPASAALAAANKRIQNILRQAGGPHAGVVDGELLREPAEVALAERMHALEPEVARHLSGHDYTGALTTLAALREPVDAFFDSVRVMDDDEQVRANRLSLLGGIGELFGRTADISRLQDQ